MIRLYFCPYFISFFIPFCMFLYVFKCCNLFDRHSKLCRGGLSTLFWGSLLYSLVLFVIISSFICLSIYSYMWKCVVCDWDNGNRRREMKRVREWFWERRTTEDSHSLETFHKGANVSIHMFRCFALSL